MKESSSIKIVNKLKYHKISLPKPDTLHSIHNQPAANNYLSFPIINLRDQDLPGLIAPWSNYNTQWSIKYQHGMTRPMTFTGYWVS